MDIKRKKGDTSFEDENFDFDDINIDDSEDEINIDSIDDIMDDEDTEGEESADESIDDIQFDEDDAEEEPESPEDIDIDIDIEEPEPIEEPNTPTDNKIAVSDEDLLGIDDEIAKLSAELSGNSGESFFDDDNGADDNGSILDGGTLLDDDEDVGDTFEVAPKDADFISPSGEIVVMNPNDQDDNFRLKYINIENIAIVKRIRSSNNVEDLVKSIRSTGLLKPIDVAPTSAEGFYVLLDGYRRIIASARCGIRRIPCVINTKVNVPEIPVLEALYNHSKKYSIKEMIDYIDYLEKEKGIMSATMIEYLLQMNSGDYTKLKDILNDNDDDIVSKLMEGQYTIEMAFKKLEQRRKKESADEKELKKAVKVYEEDPDSGAQTIEDSGETSDDGVELSEDEISKLAISANQLDEVDEEDLGELMEKGESVDGFKPHKQDPNNREYLDPKVRKSVLARDNNTCQICKMISGMEFTEVLDVHHIQEVYLGGDDSIDNLITACTVCHKLVHLYGRGDLHIRPIEEMSEAEQSRFKRVVRLGTVIREGMALKGIKREQLKKIDNADTIGRTKPGTSQVAG